MERVHYAGGSILTGSDIAFALVDFAEALAQAGAAATVVVPTVQDDGSPGESHILVGPSSQMITVHEQSDVADPVDARWLERYRVEAEDLRRLGAPGPVAAPEDRTVEQFGLADDY